MTTTDNRVTHAELTERKKTVAAAALAGVVDADMASEIAGRIARSTATTAAALWAAEGAAFILRRRELANAVLEVLDIADEEARAAADAAQVQARADYIARVDAHLAAAKAPADRSGRGEDDRGVMAMTMKELVAMTDKVARRADDVHREQYEGIEVLAAGIDPDRDFQFGYEVRLTPDMMGVLLEAAARHSADPKAFWLGQS